MVKGRTKGQSSAQSCASHGRVWSLLSSVVIITTDLEVAFSSSAFSETTTARASLEAVGAGSEEMSTAAVGVTEMTGSQARLAKA